MPVARPARLGAALLLLFSGCEPEPTGGGRGGRLRPFEPPEAGPEDAASRPEADADPRPARDGGDPPEDARPPRDARPPPVDATPTPPVEPPDALVVATYNVENLFDLVDDPGVDEGEFTPAPGRWDATRLSRRMTELARAFRAIDADVVTVLEVENVEILAQLRDAIVHGGGPRYPYVAITTSRDPRGIDIGLLSRYPIARQLSRPIRIEHRCLGSDGQQVVLDGSWPEARPILQVELELDGRPGGDLVLMANHWKAKGRQSFPCTSDEHRVRSARQLRELMEEELAARPEVGIVGIGDFNAFEFEPPLRDVLGARLDLAGDGWLFNAWGDAGVVDGRTTNSNAWNDVRNSSYAFSGGWSRLDHLLLTRNLVDGTSGWRLARGSVSSVHDAFLLTESGHPRSWSMDDGAGFSDHLPVRLRLNRAP